MAKKKRRPTAKPATPRDQAAPQDHAAVGPAGELLALAGSSPTTELPALPAPDEDPGASPTVGQPTIPPPSWDAATTRTPSWATPGNQTSRHQYLLVAALVVVGLVAAFAVSCAALATSSPETGAAPAHPASQPPDVDRSATLRPETETPGPSTAGSTAPVLPTAASPAGQPATELYGYASGTWNGHGRTMTVSDRNAHLQTRTYVSCARAQPGQPCDSASAFGYAEVDLQLEARDGVLWATVVTSNDAPDFPIGTRYRLVPGADHTMALQWVSGGSGDHGPPGGFPMCHDTLTNDPSACGA